MKLYELTIEEAHGLLKNKEISSVELTRSVLERIDAADALVGAYITVTPETALAQAEISDKMIAAGDISPLTGIPIAVKDLICTKGILTTCASRILYNFIPPYDATVIEKLNRVGAVMVGKTNMDEFAMGSSTENSAMKITHNPWDLDRIPGGSSGGSAAAVAAGMCLGALGSDTGGSIRQPASHCGVVGMKPTYGRVSRFGLVAFASSLDQIGPITRTAADCALMMNAICGYDPRDSTSAPVETPDFTKFAQSGREGLTIGIPREYFETEGLAPAVKEAVKRAVTLLESQGARSVAISLPHTPCAVAAYYIIAPSEASSNLARFDGVKYGARDKTQPSMIEMYRKTRANGFGAEVQRRIILGTYSLSAGYYDAYYNKASRVRTLIMEDFNKAFEHCDLIVSPVTPSPAFKIGENISDPLTMYLSDIYTLSANLAGIPGMSIPCGFSAEGLPIGMQLLGNRFDEKTLLKTALSFQSATDYHLKKPAIDHRKTM